MLKSLFHSSKNVVGFTFGKLKNNSYICIMKKLTYIINEGSESYGMEFITDRTPQWTEEQYCRNRNCSMKLLGEEPTDETIGTARKVEL